MKRLIRLFLLFLVLSFGTNAVAQNKLLITDIQIKSNEMNKFERFADKEANVASDLPVTIALFKDRNLTYYSCFHLTERGKKYRVVNHDFVVHNGERFKGDKQTLKYKKTAGVRGRISGISEQQIVFDKDLERSIQLIYRFEIILD